MDNVIYVTEAEVTAARDAACARMGITWEQLCSFVDDCGCCLTIPDEFEHISEDYARRVYWDYKPMGPR